MSPGDALHGDRPVDAGTLVAVPRLAYIDQLRAVAALYVAVFHALLVIWPNGGPNPPWYLRWADYGHFSVTAFIVLSGFSLALKPAVRGRETAGPYWRFMLKRGLRMLPPYWVALTGCIVLLYLAPGNVARGNSGGVGGEWTGKGPVPAKSVVSFFLLIHDIVKVPSPNSPLWSIAVEWHLYFLFPLLVFLGCRFGMKWVLAGALVAGVGLHFVLWGTDARGTTPHFLPMFTLGIVTAFALGRHLRGERSWSPPDLSGWWLIGLSFVVFCLLSHLEVLGDLVGGALFATGVYLLACQHSSGEIAAAEVDPERPVSSRAGFWMARVGLISYSIYLVHSPTEKIVWHFVVKRLDLPDSWAYLVLVVTSLMASVAAAYVLYLLIEKRSMEWSRRIRLD